MKDKKRSKGFTLIELIAVLVILAVIATIVTLLVLNVVKKAKDSANKRSVDAYGKALDLAVEAYLLNNGEFPTNINDLEVDYTGLEVVCGTQYLNEDSSVYLSECTVGGKEVKDSKTTDGWYHYGKTSIITYQSYKVGDQVTYKGIDFYVIADSNEKKDSVILLKAEPLTVDEVNLYGIDANGVNHVNVYTYPQDSSSGVAYDSNGYGGMAYYSSETCKRVNTLWVDKGCTTNYDKSDIKYVVDAWSMDKLTQSDLKEDRKGYKVRLITVDELVANLGYPYPYSCSGGCISYPNLENIPSFVYNSKYSYWTMTPYSDAGSYVYYVRFNGSLLNYDIIKDHVYSSEGGMLNGSVRDYSKGVVRPVINLLKSAI